MDTAHKTEEEKREYFDSEEFLDQKVTALAEWIKKSKHFIVFTGAGISTSAGIPDYRSGINTVLPTGPGAWEKLATGVTKSKANLRTSMASAIPTPCHMALVKLMEVGYLKFIISQNVDGLHRKSGIPAKKIAEVHGNRNLEVCKNKGCQRQFLRDFGVRTAKKVHDHKTGRYCESCGKDLYDSIINFGENLPDKELEQGFLNGSMADLCLAMGSSLTVTPAADMPEQTAKNGGRLVIVNLQATPLDKQGLRINGLIDDVIIRLMKKLDLEIPPFKLQRRIAVTKTNADPKNPTQKGKLGAIIRGVDESGLPHTLFKSMTVNIEGSGAKETITQTKEPCKIYPTKVNFNTAGVVLKAKFTFQGHYGEPDLSLDISMDSLKLNTPIYYYLEFDPQVGKWVTFKQLETLA